MRQKLQARLRRYFISGFFAVIPAGLSVLVVWTFVRTVDRTLAPVLETAFGFELPGLGLVAALLLILGAGVVTSHVVGERLIMLAEEFLARIPVFKWVYPTIKQMTEAFSPANKASFKSVVMVEFPRPGVYSMGFATGETVLDLPDGSHKKLTAVYIPTNHVYVGDVIFVPSELVLPSHLSVQQGIQVVLSAGAVHPERPAHPKRRPE